MIPEIAGGIKQNLFNENFCFIVTEKCDRIDIA